MKVQAMRFTAEADALRIDGHFLEASLRCNDALDLVPNYGAAILKQSQIYLYYIGKHWSEISQEERLRFADLAFRASSKCLDLCPEWNLAHLVHTQNVIYESVLFDDKAGLQFAMDHLNEMLGEAWNHDPLTAFETSFALSCRVQCHLLLGSEQRAREDYDRAIKLNPRSYQLHSDKARLLNRPS